METYHAIGVMSGSSLDGIDVAYCKFILQEKNWRFTILKSSTYPLGIWAKILKNVSDLNAQDLVALDFEFGSFLGKTVKDFMSLHNISQIDLIASHGHTIFHNPSLGFTCQIGNGNAIAKETSHLVVADLRSADIVAGGQGAPIVPIGDFHLFQKHEFCLNIGGIANMSYKTQDKIIAFDICSANQILNYYANQKGEEYDENGALASKGTINNTLLKTLNQIEYYKNKPPKSLDNSFSQISIEIMEGYQSLSVEDKLATYVEHMAFQINLAVESSSKKMNQQSLLITGGGAFNSYLINRIKAYSKLKLNIPSCEIINFKEAMVMAFMGVLRMRNEINCFASVTGASKNTCGGVVFQP